LDSFENELKLGFLEEADQLLNDAEQCFLSLENAAGNPEIIEKIFRLAHNLKGSAGAVGFAEFAHFTHQLESFLLKIKKKEIQVQTDVVNLLLKCNDRLKEIVAGLRADLAAVFNNDDLISAMNAAMDPMAAQLANLTAERIEESAPAPAPARDPLFQPLRSPGMAAAPPPPPALSPGPQVKAAVAAKADENIRVSLARLDRLMNNVGELVILQTVLAQHRNAMVSPLLQKTVGQLGKITKEIQDISMSLRMVPLKQTFQKLQRIVRDASKALGKNVELQIAGEETELDKTVLEQIGDPLVHLVRNAVDHGLEATEERIKAGKSSQGLIRIKAYHRGSQIVIEVGDDGRGLDAQRLTKKAIEKGVLPAGATLSDKDAYQLIFAPGFSTKTEVTDISGRGVGMDVVKTNISHLQGELELDTQLGMGTTFKVVLPLTLAIIDGMIVKMGEERFVVPLAQIHESLQPAAKDLSSVGETGELLNLRGETLPVIRLSRMLGRKISERSPSQSIAIVVRDDKASAFSVLVDDILGQQQVVIKRLGDELQGLNGISGGAILGDGKVALILDLQEMVRHYRATKGSRPSVPARPTIKEAA